jgi:hypothetical protein
MSEHGEPWRAKIVNDDIVVIENVDCQKVAELNAVYLPGRTFFRNGGSYPEQVCKTADRAVACVNACADFDDPVEMRRLAVAAMIAEHYGIGTLGICPPNEHHLTEYISMEAESLIAWAKKYNLPEIAMLEKK